MDVTSDEIRSSRFQGTRHVYDRREVDAFLHRTAATLELYERKLTVTEAHVRSLETALELAQSRARSTRQRDARIAELEAALAAAQHHYESAVAAAAAHAERAGQDAAESAAQVEAAAAEAAEIRKEATALRAQAADSADGIVAAARAEAEDILRTALTVQTEMVADLDRAHAEAKAAIAEREREVPGDDAATIAELTAELEDARKAAAHAEEALGRAQRLLIAAEEDVAASESDLDELRTAAADAEVHAAAAEARYVAMRVAADEQVVLAQQRAGEAEERAAQLAEDLEGLSAEMAAQSAAAEAKQLELLASAEQLAADAEERAAAAMAGQQGALDEVAEVPALRRQVAQMRTALSNIQRRFANAARLSPEEMELAAALVDLDLHDVDQLVDLTSPAMTDASPRPSNDDAADDAAPADGETAAVSGDAATDAPAVKSKWAQAGAVPAGSLRGGRADTDDGRRVWPNGGERPANWRESAASTRKRPAKPEVEEPEEEALGFYERRLAGLRERLNDAKNDG